MRGSRQQRAEMISLSVVLLTVLLTSAVFAAETSLRKGKPAPELSWLGTDGLQYSWGDIRQKKPAVIVFWGTWCAVCKKDWPELIAVEKEFATMPEPPVWIAVAVLDSAEKAARAATDRQLPGVQLCDPEEKNFAALGLAYVPTVCVLDSTGKVVFVGEPNPKKLRKVLAGLNH